MSKTVKAYLKQGENVNAEICHFVIDLSVSSSYESLSKKVAQVFPSLGSPDNFFLSWEDSEGNNITFSSDDELMEGLGQVNDIFHIYVKEKKKGRRDGPCHGASTEDGNPEDQAYHSGVICECEVCESRRWGFFNRSHDNLQQSSPSTILLNARSLCNKVDALVAMIHELLCKLIHIHVIAVTETWFSTKKLASAYTLQGYHQFHHDRKDRTGGGVALYVRDNINATRVFEDIVPPDLEVLWVKIRSSPSLSLKKNIFICTVYHPPKSRNHEKLCTHIINMVKRIRMSESASFLIMGDFNHLNTKPIEQLLLSQIVAVPTKKIGAAILDKIFTDMGGDYHDPVAIAPIGKSDHMVIFIAGKPMSGHSPRQTLRHSSRPFHESSVRSFGRWIRDADWSGMDKLIDSDLKADWLQKVITAQYRFHFDEITITHPLNDEIPVWMNNCIRGLMQTCDAHCYPGNELAYEQSCKFLQQEIMQAKKNFYAKNIEHLKHSEPDKWHQWIRVLTGMHKSSTLLLDTDEVPSEIAHALNYYFATSCNQLPKLDLARLPAYLPAPPPPIIKRQEVYKCLKRLNASKAGHPTDVPIRLLKEFASELSIPLTTLFNDCLRNGNFPSCWKTASVCPVPKMSPVTEFEQIMPIMAHILEGFLANWVLADIQDLIDPKQFGNIKGSSASHYLISLLDGIHQGLNKQGHHATICTIDFMKAFELIDHTKVIEKLIQMDVNPNIIKVIASFLSQRMQTTRYHGTSSSQQELSCGVPQGTKLGKVILLIMINDAAWTTEKRWKYVDDLTIAEVVHKSGASHIQHHVEALSEWSCLNLMKPNAEKCKVMHVSFLRNGPPPPVITIGNVVLESVSTLRLLGVTIQSNLKWDAHVEQVIKCASQGLDILCELKKNGVSEADLVFIYTVDIRPLMEVCAPVWSSGLTKRQSDSIERVQHRALRMISYPDQYDYEKLLSRFSIPSLATRRKDLLTNFAESILISSRHRDLLPAAQQHPSRTGLRNSHHIRIPQAKTQRYKQSSVPTLVNLINAQLTLT